MHTFFMDYCFPSHGDQPGIPLLVMMEMKTKAVGTFLVATNMCWCLARYHLQERSSRDTRKLATASSESTDQEQESQQQDDAVRRKGCVDGAQRQTISGASWSRCISMEWLRGSYQERDIRCLDARGIRTSADNS